MHGTVDSATVNLNDSFFLRVYRSALGVVQCSWLHARKHLYWKAEHLVGVEYSLSSDYGLAEFQHLSYVICLKSVNG